MFFIFFWFQFDLFEVDDCEKIFKVSVVFIFEVIVNLVFELVFNDLNFKEDI